MEAKFYIYPSAIQLAGTLCLKEPKITAQKLRHKSHRFQFMKSKDVFRVYNIFFTCFHDPTSRTGLQLERNAVIQELIPLIQIHILVISLTETD